MTPPGAGELLAFSVAATLLTLVPGLDNALVLRMAVSEGARRALLAGLGIAISCLVWGMLVAVGLGALLAASRLTYSALRIVGACYLLYLGLRMVWSPRQEFGLRGDEEPSGSGARWLVRGLLTNILNPKVGVLYISFLPQFIPVGADVAASMILLTGIHAGLSLIWFGVLVTATRPIARALHRGGVVAWLDRVTGGVFVLFGLRLALGESR